jgi:hypothetical protein
VEEVEGLDAHAIAGQDEPALGLGPEGDGEHAAEFLEAAEIPLEEGFEDDLGVRVCVEAMAESFKFLSNFSVVVDLAVIDDNGVFVRRVDGLVALGEINDGEPGVAEGDERGFVGSLVVRTAMADGLQDAVNPPAL